MPRVGELADALTLDAKRLRDQAQQMEAAAGVLRDTLVKGKRTSALAELLEELEEDRRAFEMQGDERMQQYAEGLIGRLRQATQEGDADEG